MRRPDGRAGVNDDASDGSERCAKSGRQPSIPASEPDGRPRNVNVVPDGTFPVSRSACIGVVG